MAVNLRELNKLEEYLKKNNYTYDRTDNEVLLNGYDIGRYQIIVYENGTRVWDAICRNSNDECKNGLLEVMGDPVIKCSDGARYRGGLTAIDVIECLEGGLHEH